MTSEFSAVGPALGYYYQIRYALFLLLKSPPDVSVSIERFDDVAFEKEGTPLELIQTKHHLNQSAVLTNSSTDLWKTIRVWCTSLLKGVIDPSKVKLILATTSKAPEGTAAYKLYPDDTNKRDVKGALEILGSIANSSKSIENKKAYELFLSLNKSQKEKLLSCVTVVDSSPSISNIKQFILDELIYATRPEFLEVVYERLEGFWLNKSILHLSSEDYTTITHSEVLEFINDLQEQFHRDNLPIDFYDLKPPKEEDIEKKDKIFIEQLKLVSVGPSRIQKAISDYYRAYTQRSKWIRDDLILIAELENYELKLVDEWERRFEAMREDILGESENVVRKEGRALFNWMDMEARTYIRERCDEPYIVRGSYHILSNQLRIGWHSEFTDKLKSLFQEVVEGRNENA